MAAVARMMFQVRPEHARHHQAFRFTAFPRLRDHQSPRFIDKSCSWRTHAQHDLLRGTLVGNNLRRMCVTLGPPSCVRIQLLLYRGRPATAVYCGGGWNDVDAQGYLHGECLREERSQRATGGASRWRIRGRADGGDKCQL